MTPSEIDAVLASIGASVERRPETRYRLSGAVVQRGVSAFNVNTVIGADGYPSIGAMFVNAFPGGGGELIRAKGDGSVQFIYYTSAAFSGAGNGPFTVYLADGGTKDEDPPRHIHPGALLSDIVHSLGDFEGTHTEIYLQFVERSTPVVVPPATIPTYPDPLRDSVRAAAWTRRGVDFNPDAALFKKALNASLGYPLSQEYKFKDDAGILYVGQDFSGGTVYCRVGDYGNIKVNSWL